MTRLNTVDPVKPSSTCHFDWLTVVLPIPNSLAERFGRTIQEYVDYLLENLYLGDMTWEDMEHGLYRYERAKACGQSIIVAWNIPHKVDYLTKENIYAKGKNTLMIQLSGEGVETLESILENKGAVIADFVSICLDFYGRFTRVDACTNFFNYPHFYSARYVNEQIEAGRLITRSTTVRSIKSYNSSGALPEGEEAYQGSQEGFTTYIGVNPKQLRIYNKLSERRMKIDRRYNLRSWSRWEFQLNGVQAQKFIEEYEKSDYDLVQTWINWLASNYRFIDDRGQKKQAKRDRYPTAKWWDKLVKNATKKIKVRTEKQLPTFERQKSWIDSQVLPTLAAMYQARFKKYKENGVMESDARRMAIKKVEREINETIEGGRVKESKVKAYLEERWLEDEY